MAVAVTYPGVYVEEIPSGLHTITGVATSIAAFIDTFQRGPLNYAVHLLSMSDFERQLGGLDTTSEASYAIQQFFLNGGTEAYAVRVAGAAAAAASVNAMDKVVLGALVFKATAGRKVGTVELDNTGLWGNNLRMEIDYQTSDPKTLYNLTISELDAAFNTLRSETFRNLSTKATDPNFVVDVVNSGSIMVYLTAGPSSNKPVANGTVGTPLLKVPPPIPIIAPKTTCSIKIDGIAAANTCTLTLPALAADQPTDYPGLRPYVEAAIRAADPLLSAATVELWGAGKSGNEYFFRVLTGTGNAKPKTIVEFSDTGVGVNVMATALNLKKSASVTANVQQSFFTGGIDDTTIDSAAIRGLPAKKSGIYALDDVDLFNILCIPAATTGTALGLIPDDVRSIFTEATRYCDDRRAMFIVDIPASVQDLTSMQTWMTQNDTARDPNLAVYFPRVRIPDPLNGSRLRDMGPSGTIAGIWAATDVARGVWKAPAGVDTQLRNVSQLVYSLTDRENGVLNPLGINCLRNFPVYGNVSWGARTLYGSDVQASDWKYIPIRRLALFLEESLFRGSKWVVFEPNDEPLWAQIRMNVGSFMHDLFRQGAFQGSTPEQAYLVKCDAEINTPYEVNRGIVNILVGFAPLKPAEFVIIQIQQLISQTPE